MQPVLALRAEMLQAFAGEIVDSLLLAASMQISFSCVPLGASLRGPSKTHVATEDQDSCARCWALLPWPAARGP